MTWAICCKVALVAYYIWHIPTGMAKTVRFYCPKIPLLLAVAALQMLTVVASQFNGFLSEESQTFASGDTLVSTLGYFKITLLAEGCRLQVEEFQQTRYKIVDHYQSSQTIAITACRYLQFNTSQGRLQTDDGSTFL